MKREKTYPSRDVTVKTEAKPPRREADPFALGRLLIDGRFINDKHLEKALAVQEKERLLLGECLIRIGAITREILETVLRFQKKIRKILREQAIDKRIKIGRLLVATGLVSQKAVKRALTLQRKKKKLLGEILVEEGEICAKLLSLTLKSQKKILILIAGSIIGLSALGCATVEASYYDHMGTPVQTTPYDIRYDRIKEHLKESRKILYKQEEAGRDYWQLPVETEFLGTGDCEDKAIWLYSKLLEEGFDDIRLVVGDYVTGKESRHVWISWHYEGRTYIIDPSTNDKIWEADKYPEGYYKPIYSFYRNSKWKHDT